MQSLDKVISPFLYRELALNFMHVNVYNKAIVIYILATKYNFKNVGKKVSIIIL